MTAVTLFHGNWFLRDEPKLELTFAEESFIDAALGIAPKRWEGQPDLAQMGAILDGYPHVLSRIGERLLTVAIGMRGCGPAVQYLLEHDVPLNQDMSTYNTLHEAAWANSVDTLKALFEAGATDATAVALRKPHTGWPDNVSLMYWAAWGGYPELARLLIEYGAGANHDLPIKGNGERGTTSLQEAAAPGPWAEDNPLRSNAGKIEVARILIEDGADYDAWTACGLEDTAQLQTLIHADRAVAHAADAFGMVPLHWAARVGSLACIRLLLDNGVDVDAANRVKRTPMQLAAEQDRGEAIRLLAAHGADLDTQDNKGRTPLHRAAYEGKLAAINALLAAGADPTVRNKAGKTAFEVARKEAKYLKPRP